MKKIGFNCWRNIIVNWMWITKFSTIRRKTTDLREDNHQLKLDIQELNQQISDSKSKIKGLEKDKENSKKLHLIIRKLN